MVKFSFMHFPGKHVLKSVLTALKEPTRLCLLCNKPLSDSQGFLADFFLEDPVCARCRNKLTWVDKKIKVNQLLIHGLYLYDEEFQSWIIQYKECFDEILAPVFLLPYLGRLKKEVKGAVLIPAPSSFEKLEERGFHHVRELFLGLNAEIEECFIKTKNIKQSLLRRDKRKQIKDVIELKELPKKGRKIILVDDVCTTGSTLLAMHEMLLKNGIKSTALVLAVHPLLLQQSDSIRQKRKSILRKK